MKISNSVVDEVSKCGLYSKVNHTWVDEHAFPPTGFSCGLARLYVALCLTHLCRTDSYVINCLDERTSILAHLSRRLTGELIG